VRAGTHKCNALDVKVLHRGSCHNARIAGLQRKTGHGADAINEANLASATWTATHALYCEVDIARAVAWDGTRPAVRSLADSK
jgi:hypothetical protein